MRVKKINIKNFRLLKDVELSLEEETTVIVGRNNSGKTSLTEMFRRLLSGNTPSFLLEDFTLSVHEKFWDAFILYKQEAEESEIRNELPFIELKLTLSYDTTINDLGTLSEFIIDIDIDSTEAITVMRYQLKDGGVDLLFKDINYSPDSEINNQKNIFFKTIKERIPKLFTANLKALDPTDDTNNKALELSKFRSLLQAGFINAQRGLDDTTHKEKDVLGKVLERLLDTACSETASIEDLTTTQALEGAVQDIQAKIDSDFNTQLNKLLPALSLFGYPGLNDPKLFTETTLDVKRLLENHTKLRYSVENGFGLPETYNGLGSRNLIYILFQLYEFFKSYKSNQPVPGVHLVFIEEPEAHLHPQMMEVFIRKLKEIVQIFAEQLNANQPWPVQFIVTSHSTHLANEAAFESIRYFLCTKDGGQHTQIKDLREGFGSGSFDEDREFLHKYMTLTRCDLFFADKAMLIEGPTERLLMPEMIKKLDEELPAGGRLSSQYVSTIEVGGAYAHHFFRLLDFLEIRTLIITDIDSVKASESSSAKIKCKVVEGTHTSNACTKSWFNDTNISPTTLISKSDEEKTKNYLRLTFQIPEITSTACGRSFEDAFLLANMPLFEIEGNTDSEKADSAWAKVENINKTDFALKYAIDDTNWVIPKYIKDGLLWLAENPSVLVSVATSLEPEIETDSEEVA